MRSGNPVLGENTFLDVGSGQVVNRADDVMSINGTVTKTALLLACLIAGAAFTWSKFDGTPAGAQAVLPWLAVGVIGGLIMAFITVFKKTWAPVTAPVYAVLEGLALGAISAIYELRFHGIVLQAVAMTFGVLFMLLAVYRTGLIKVTDNFRLGVVAATGGILLVYFADFVLGMFGHPLGFLRGSSMLSIGISVFVVIIASLNLVLDFDFIERGAEARAPKYMEWYAAFGLMVTLVWLYLEILRLLSKLQSRN